MTTPADPTRPAGSRGLRKLLASGEHNSDGRMPLMDHIRELRNRVLKALLAVSVGAIIGWFLYPHIWSFIEAPYCRLRIHNALAPHGCTLYVNGLFDALFLRLKIAIASGIILTSPIWMYQLWAFIAPGLYSRERRWGYFFAGSAVPLFAIGGGIAYFAMTKGLRFLIFLIPKGVLPLITIDTYLGYAMAMLLIFGLAFELPLVLCLLNLARVLTHERFRKWRRMIIFLVFAFAAVATPSPDPISMLLLAVPCVILVEAAEVFAWANDRRIARQPSAYDGLSPDEIAPLDLGEDTRDGVDAGHSSE